MKVVAIVGGGGRWRCRQGQPSKYNPVFMSPYQLGRAMAGRQAELFGMGISISLVIIGRGYSSTDVLVDVKFKLTNSKMVATHHWREILCLKTVRFL